MSSNKQLFFGITLPNGTRFGLDFSAPPHSKIERVDVESSLIESLTYISEAELLRVAFNNGTTYEYSGVAPEIFEKFSKAESHGKYFHTYIRNQYPTVRLVDIA